MQTPLQDPDFILYTDDSDSVSLGNAEDDAAAKPPGISSSVCFLLILRLGPLLMTGQCYKPALMSK